MIKFLQWLTFFVLTFLQHIYGIYGLGLGAAADIRIGFNPKFFTDALKVIDDEEIDIYMVNPKAPCFIKDEEETYLYLILPVNISV